MKCLLLSVIGAAKVSHFEILCRVHGFEPTVGLFRFFYMNSKNKGWMSFKLDLHSFIRTADPTKVRIGERQRDKDEPKLLETTVGRVVLLLPVAPARSSGELETSVDKLFDEGGSGSQAKQGDSVSDGGGQVKASKEKKNQCYWCWGDPISTLPFVTSFVSATPERESEDSSYHSGANIAEAEVDSFFRPSVPVITTTTTVTPLLGDFANLSSSDFLIGGIRTVISLDTDLQKVYVPQWSVTNGSHLDDGCVCCEMIDEFFPLSFLHQFAGKVKTLKEHNTILEKEKNELDVKVVDLAGSVKVREQEVTDLDVVVTFVKSQNDNLMKKVHELKVSYSKHKEKLSNYENLTKRLEEFQDSQLNVVNDKFEKLYADFVEMSLHLEERFYPHLLNTIIGRWWLLTYGMELAIAKCLNSSEYLSALGAAIGKANEKGMQDWLAARITHGKEGRVLADVTAYNPSTEVGYISALQQLQSVNFSLLTALKINKDSSVETLINILRLEEFVAERLGLNES
nr:transposase (putative), gypsy type [Tanacetum cinerariifolium]